MELVNLERTRNYQGKVTRIIVLIDQSTQSIKAYIDVSHTDLKEGMYIEANLNAKDEKEAIEIDRKLLLEDNQIFVVRDSILDLIDVKPVYFSDRKVVLKDVPDGTTIITQPVVGAYAGMLVKVYKEQTAENIQ